MPLYVAHINGTLSPLLCSHHNSSPLKCTLALSAEYHQHRSHSENWTWVRRNMKKEDEISKCLASFLQDLWIRPNILQKLLLLLLSSICANVRIVYRFLSLCVCVCAVWVSTLTCDGLVYFFYIYIYVGNTFSRCFSLTEALATCHLNNFPLRDGYPTHILHAMWSRRLYVHTMSLEISKCNLLYYSTYLHICHEPNKFSQTYVYVRIDVEYSWYVANHYVLFCLYCTLYIPR